jgi:hypothetical protein
MNRQLTLRFLPIHADFAERNTVTRLRLCPDNAQTGSNSAITLQLALKGQLPNRYSCFCAKFNTRAETAPFFSMPPRITGPSGVERIPRPSARTSNVSSVTISQ